MWLEINKKLLQVGVIRHCPTLYMAAEVKRKNYPLRIGFQLFSCFRSRNRTH